MYGKRMENECKSITSAHYVDAKPGPSLGPIKDGQLTSNIRIRLVGKPSLSPYLDRNIERDDLTLNVIGRSPKSEAVSTVRGGGATLFFANSLS